MRRPLGLGFAWLALSLMVAVASAQRGPGGSGGPGGGGNNDQGNRPPVQVQPEVIVPIDPFPRATGIQTVDQLMKELAQCRAGGQLDLVLCLRGDMSSVNVRRLEACLGSYLIPDDPAPIRACFASLPR